jgi:subtilisin family serine protease
MKKFTFLIIALLFGAISYSQVAPDKYYIQFTDKSNSPYSINNPEEFLTQRAIDRRAKYNIDITEQDLPVNQSYIDGVAATGADLLFSTKWMNGITIYTTSSSVIQDILSLPYVESSTKLLDRENPGKKEYLLSEGTGEHYSPENLKSTNSEFSMGYGAASNQIEQLNGVLLHDEGFKGEGMVIAVLDGGFEAVDTHPLFDSLWNNNRILGTKDFVHPGGSVFNESGHGRMVLSCMGADKDGLMIGTAPKASYWLLRSEYVVTENVLEEYNWVCAAEFADSVGADVINSSLGYVDFDNADWNHSHDDLNGSTAVVTIGADIAVNKGIMVVNSAGNDGSNSWFPWVGAPADGFNVFTIGAVTADGFRAGFSSIGPTGDNRIKPLVMSQGQGAALADGDDGVTYNNGTSFSSPIMAGMTACLMQAYPNKTPLEIQESLKQSGDHSSSPDNDYGWGIPDFMAAYSILTTVELGDNNKSDLAYVYPNPFTKDFTLRLDLDKPQNVKLSLMDVNGRLIFSQEFLSSDNENQLAISDQISDLTKGVYFLTISSSTKYEVKRLVKN